jgi:hypothetical protein
MDLALVVPRIAHIEDDIRPEVLLGEMRQEPRGDVCGKEASSTMWGNGSAKQYSPESDSPIARACFGSSLKPAASSMGNTQFT